MKRKIQHPIYRLPSRALYLDLPLLLLLLCLMVWGLVVLYSASNQNTSMVLRQAMRLFLAMSVMVFLAFIPPHKYKAWTPGIYAVGLFFLLAVMVMGKIGKGAQRWLDLGLFRFQPSEIMKLAVPMMAAWIVDKKTYPIDARTLMIVLAVILFPVLLIAKQPDLGTAIMVALAGLSVVFLAGISAQVIAITLILLGLLAPILWHFMHDYQKLRILMLLDPEKDPLGAGYHIIQSKIAIGSGGGLGKGWLAGSLSHLNFLPEHATDFIFAVNGEEFGFLGSVGLITLILVIALRCFNIAINAQTCYTRLLAVSVTMMFFFSAFVNMGMVMGLLPVVGIPLPLVSYGGSAMVTFLAGFGLLMSIASHRILFDRSG